MQQLRSLYSLLGFLRFNLISFSYALTLIHIFDRIFFNTASAGIDSVWGIIVLIIVQIATPLFIIVLFLDFLMSKLRASDAEGQEKLNYQKIVKIERWSLWILFAYWVLFFYSFMS